MCVVFVAIDSRMTNDNALLVLQVQRPREEAHVRHAAVEAGGLLHTGWLGVQGGQQRLLIETVDKVLEKGCANLREIFSNFFSESC